MVHPVETLLQAARENLRVSPAWWVRPISPRYLWEGGVRPGVQWFRMRPPIVDAGGTAGEAYEVLVAKGQAYLSGDFRLAVLGWSRSLQEVDRAIGARWVRCRAGSFLAQAEDHSAWAMFSKQLPEEGEPLRLLPAASEAGTGDAAGEVLRILAPQPLFPGDAPLVVTVASAVGAGLDGVRLLALGDEDDPRLAAVSYGDEPLPLPDPHEVGVVDLADALSELAARRGPQRRESRAGAVHRVVAAPLVHVDAIEEPDGGGWSVSSEDVVTALGVISGHDAEELVREHLARHAPHLLDVLEFDSSGEAVMATATSQHDAEGLADVLRTMHASAAGGGSQR